MSQDDQEHNEFEVNDPPRTMPPGRFPIGMSDESIEEDLIVGTNGDVQTPGGDRALNTPVIPLTVKNAGGASFPNIDTITVSTGLSAAAGVAGEAIISASPPSSVGVQGDRITLLAVDPDMFPVGNVGTDRYDATGYTVFRINISAKNPTGPAFVGNVQIFYWDAGLPGMVAMAAAFAFNGVNTFMSSHWTAIPAGGQVDTFFTATYDAAAGVGGLRPVNLISVQFSKTATVGTGGKGSAGIIPPPP